MFRIIPPKFSKFYSELKNKKFALLDVGAGTGSPTKTKRIFPNCEYHGIDKGNYHNTQADFDIMDAYYEMDLTELKFDKIPNQYFDVMILSHVIEHLENGDAVIKGLLPKLKSGAHVYIEFPGKRSLKLPSMRNTLNFYDDPTHVRVYSAKEISEILDRNGFLIKSAGTRRHWPYMLLMPFTIIHQTIKHGFLPGGVFWDITGFAEYVYAVKK
jgi:2-polyprenyl-3-methyl-5-hydroxy-6-metoxy-1,4-benzoquinol methylase